MSEMIIGKVDSCELKILGFVCCYFIVEVCLKVVLFL